MTSIRVSDDNIEFDKKNLETMEMFAEIINETNIKVVDSWKQAQANKSKDAESATVINEISPEEVLSA